MGWWDHGELAIPWPLKITWLCSPDSETIGILNILASSIGGVACLHFGAGMLLPLQGAAAGCRCRVVMQGAAWGASVGVVCALWSGRWCRCRVPLEGAAVRGALVPDPVAILKSLH